MYISAVNLTEVATRLLDNGINETRVRATIEGLPVTIVPFDAIGAMNAALLRPLTRSARLSLGDRACLALAIKLNLPVLTADRAWAALDLPVEVILAR